MKMTGMVEQLRAKEHFVCTGAVAKEQIGAAEKALQLHFSDEYREYSANCGAASFDGHELTGVCAFPRLNVVDVTIKERSDNPLIPLHLYVVEQTHYDGVVIWQAENGDIYQSQPGTGPVQIAGSLAEYLEL